MRELGATAKRYPSAPVDGESQQQVAQRSIRALAELSPAPCSLVVAHGGVIRALIGLSDQLDEAAITRLKIENAIPMVRDLPADHWSSLLASDHFST